MKKDLLIYLKYQINDKILNKNLIGMNQLDLWTGGQQLNRGFKYLENNIHNNNYNKIIIKNNKNKIYKLFNIGFKNNTLLNFILNYYNNSLNLFINSCFDIDLGPTVLLNSYLIFNNSLILSFNVLLFDIFIFNFNIYTSCIYSNTSK